MVSRAAVETFLAQPALALVGVSRSGKKFGNFVRRELQAKGYRVYPIHPAAAIIDGVRSYTRFADLPEHVDAALIVVPPTEAVKVVRDAAAAGIHRVWLQQGAGSPEVLRVCQELGVEAVAGECILMFAKPTGYHKAHQWVNRLLGKFPARGVM
jgi:predicted CoA-binding protein